MTNYIITLSRFCVADSCFLLKVPLRIKIVQDGDVFTACSHLFDIVVSGYSQEDVLRKFKLSFADLYFDLKDSDKLVKEQNNIKYLMLQMIERVDKK